MDLWITDRTRLIILLLACALLSSIELLVPLFRYRRGRLRRASPNLFLAAGVLMTNLALASITAGLCAVVTQWHVGLLAGTRIRPWMELVLGVAGLDLFAYLAHVLLHKLPVAWRFHRVHHSEPEVDVTTAFRQHPGETLWRFIWQCFGIVLFGLPFWVVPLYLSLSSLNALLEHANIRLNGTLDECLRWVFVTPNMHKIHHSRDISQTESNYSNIFSFWDRLFITYTHRVDFRKLQYGLDGFDDSRRHRARELMIEPFRRADNVE
jgi:sterol desaturase/sphingolipid hydroxylase (fatty acid hydroxylase superfamily)